MIGNRQSWLQLLSLLACMCVGSRCIGESALPLLSGFDVARIESAYPPDDDESTGELAKLVYRLTKADQEALLSRADDAQSRPGDACRVGGVIREMQSLEVPDRLIEFLDMRRLQVLVIDPGDDSEPIRIIGAPLPQLAKPGDKVRGLGVWIQSTDEHVVATASLSWFPKSPKSAGWKLLSEAGLDVSLLADTESRNRQTLMPEDADAFYKMLAAAAKVSTQSQLPLPKSVDPITLLSKPAGLVGQWLSMDLETVQITKIAVTEPHRQAQLGSDHYFQIDAVGDLKNVVVKIERIDGDSGPPITFENRYPVSVIVRELPDFLMARIRAQEGGDAVLSELKVLIRTDAFFYRLWSYSTDFMSSQGGGDQFGPLLVAAVIDSREPTTADPAGVGMIGWIAAIAVVTAIVAMWLWNRVTSRRDAEVRRKRKARESETLEIPV